MSRPITTWAELWEDFWLEEYGIRIARDISHYGLETWIDALNDRRHPDYRTVSSFRRGPMPFRRINKWALFNVDKANIPQINSLPPERQPVGWKSLSR